MYLKDLNTDQEGAEILMQKTWMNFAKITPLQKMPKWSVVAADPALALLTTIKIMSLINYKNRLFQ